MAKLKTYRELEVWQKAMDLVEEVYQLSRQFPDEERFALSSQIRRAAVSVPSNIAEGYARNHRKEYVQLLSVARGSLAEVETQLTLAVRLGFVDRDHAKDAWQLAQDVGMMLNRLRQSLQRRGNADAS